MNTLKIRQYVNEHWQLIASYSGLFIVLMGVLVYRLGSLLPGFSSTELQAYKDSVSLRVIFRNPVNAPFEIIGRGIYQLHTKSSLLDFRVLSVLLGVTTLVIFCGLIHYLYGYKSAIIGTVLFGTSSWFLHIARLGTPEIMLFTSLWLYSCHIWLKATKNKYALLASLILSSVLIYIPGMIWLVIGGIIFNTKAIKKISKGSVWVFVASCTLSLILVAPLIWRIYRNLNTLKIILGFQKFGWPSPLSVVHNLIDVPLNVFVYGKYSPETWLSNLPVLGIFCGVMFALGVYIYITKKDKNSVKSSLLLVFIIGALVVSLNGLTTLSLLVPFIYLVVTAGISYMFKKWYGVFPRNPIAQGVGILAILTIVSLTVFYQTRQYFVAWPQNITTQQLFRISEPVKTAAVSATISR